MTIFVTRAAVGTATALLALVLLATPAQAQGFLSGSIGAAFGGKTPDDRPTTYGVSTGVLGRAVGFEVEAAFTPDFFTDSPFVGDNSVTTVMGNVLVGSFTGPIRPYATGGLGLMRLNLEGPLGAADFDRNDLAMNAGGGVMAFLSPAFALRGDVRYYRNLNDNEEEFGVDLDQFDYWRGTVGLVIKF